MKRARLNFGLVILILSLAPACGSSDSHKKGGEVGDAASTGGSSGSGGSGTGGSGTGGSGTGGTGTGGSGTGGSGTGGSGTGGTGTGGTGTGGTGTGGSGTGGVTMAAPPGAGEATVAGGVVAKSTNFKAILTLGEPPGGNTTMTSTNHRLNGGLVGKTQ